MNRKVKEPPLMRQYRKVKEAHSDCIVLFHVGGFYRTFFQDAYVASKVLGLNAAAKKYGGQMTPVCGFPVMVMEERAATLLQKGYSVVICGQVAGETDGIVNREVKEVLRADAEIPEDCLVTEEAYQAFCADLSEKETEAAEIRKRRRIVRAADVLLSDEYRLSDELRKLDLDNLAPSQALLTLCRWQMRFGCGGGGDD